MYSTDLTNLRIQLNRMGKRVNIVKTTEAEALTHAGTEIATYTSPNVQKMIEWTRCLIKEGNTIAGP